MSRYMSKIRPLTVIRNKKGQTWSHSSENGAILTPANLCIESFRCSFWEPHPKGDKRYRPKDELSYVEHMKRGFGILKEEIKLWKSEIIEKFESDFPIYLPGDAEVIWTFDSQEKLKKWIITADKDHNEGYSECTLTLSKNKTAIFEGVLNPRVPKDGIIHRAGYCNITSMKHMKSFKRDSFYDWTIFTHLILRVRGDGRSYMINLKTPGYFDLMWNDIYNYVLYTRGGPYWQFVKIPFSKFFLSHKGRVQDKQQPLAKNNISSVGITCADAVPGPFCLEIDYIGVMYDGNHTEEFAYEMYKLPRYVAGT